MENKVKSYYVKAPKQCLDQLKDLENIIGSILKDYQIVISYGVPTFVFEGKKIVGVGGYKDFVSLYPLGHELIDKYKADLQTYKTSRGAIQFPINNPLPKKLIIKIIKDRVNFT